jgi:hypothetical protein
MEEPETDEKEAAAIYLDLQENGDFYGKAQELFLWLKEIRGKQALISFSHFNRIHMQFLNRSYKHVIPSPEINKINTLIEFKWKMVEFDLVLYAWNRRSENVNGNIVRIQSFLKKMPFYSFEICASALRINGSKFDHTGWEEGNFHVEIKPYEKTP